MFAVISLCVYFVCFSPMVLLIWLYFGDLLFVILFACGLLEYCCLGLRCLGCLICCVLLVLVIACYLTGWYFVFDFYFFDLFVM